MKEETELRLALRPYVTAGVAIVGASVIAITPVTPTPTPRQAQSHAVQLSASVQQLDAPSPFAALPSIEALPQAAAVTGLMAGSSFENPITRWMEVFETTSKSLTALFNEWAKNPFPVARQIIANQAGYANLIGTSLTTTVTGLTAWATGSGAGSLPVSIRLIAQYLAQGEILQAQNQFSRAITDLGASLFSMLNVLSLPYEISANVTAVLQKFVMVSMFDTGIIGKTGLGVLGLVQTAVQSLATTGQAVVDAGRAGDPLAALSAIVNAPAEFVDAMLNGIPNRFGRRIGGLLTLANNLTSWGLVGGLLIHIPRLIAAAITPPAPPAPPMVAGTTAEELSDDVSVLPSADAKTVSLETGATPAEETSGEATQAAPDSETTTVTEQEAPETGTAETPETDVVDETEQTDETDSTEDSEEAIGADDSEESNGPKSPNGGTDLSGGNKAEPGQTGSGTNTGTGSGSTDESDTPTTGSNNGSTGTNAGTDADNGDSGNGAGGSNDGSDGGSDS